MEKELVLKTVEALGVRLSSAQTVELLQLESRSRKAVQFRYEAQQYEEAGEQERAKSKMREAIESDPFYREAKHRLDAMTITFQGGSLFAAVSDELERKQKQQEAINAVCDQLSERLFSLELSPKPKVVEDEETPGLATVMLELTIKIHALEVGDWFISSLRSIEGGDGKRTVLASCWPLSNPSFPFYKEIKFPPVKAAYRLELRSDQKQVLVWRSLTIYVFPWTQPGVISGGPIGEDICDSRSYLFQTTRMVPLRLAKIARVQEGEPIIVKYQFMIDRVPTSILPKVVEASIRLARKAS